MLASSTFEVTRSQHECAPSGVELRRDFLRFDHASVDAIPKRATTTPMIPMIASVDIWFCSVLLLMLLFISGRKGSDCECVGVACMMETSAMDKKRIGDMLNDICTEDRRGLRCG